MEQTAAFISVQPWPQTGLLLGQATDASQAALAAFAAGPGAALAALPAAGAATAAVLASGSAAATAALNAAVAATAALPSALASGPAAAAAAFDAAVAAAAALPSALSPDAALPAAAAAAVAAAAALPAVLAPDVALPLAYDPATTARHFARRPLAVLARRASLLRELAGFGASLAADAASGRVEANAPERAATLRALIVGQGAALIKVGQAVAVRPDVLPPAYVEELAKLLDQVPPVEPLQARAALREALGALGTTAEQEFSDAATAFDSPVAAASIGQVYRATLMDGAEVAVKLQRPDILQSVSLDLHVLRSAALWLSRLPLRRQAAQGAALVEVLDVAGERFLAELDYEAEARNSVRFAALMAASESARGVVVTPAVVGRLSSRVILVQEWVSGTKLSDLPRTEENRARSEKAVRTLLLSYMVQLLETGFMHADPHPGNCASKVGLRGVVGNGRLFSPEGRLAPSRSPPAQRRQRAACHNRLWDGDRDHARAAHRFC